MSNIIKKILGAQFLMALGAVLAFLPQADYVGSFVSFLAPYQGIGYLLIGISGIMSLWFFLKPKK